MLAACLQGIPPLIGSAAVQVRRPNASAVLQCAAYVDSHTPTSLVALYSIAQLYQSLKSIKDSSAGSGTMQRRLPSRRPNRPPTAPPPPPARAPRHTRELHSRQA